MWNAGYDDGEYQNGFRYNDDFNSCQQDNRYSGYYQQPPYQMSYQSPGYQEPYFTTPQQPTYQQYPCSHYYQPTQQPTYQQDDDMTELKAMMQELIEIQQRVIASTDTHLAELEASMSTNTIALQGNTHYMGQELSQDDQVEVLSNDIEVEVVDEDVNDEDNVEAETDWLPPEAAPNVDSTCIDSFEDGIDSYNEYAALMYDLVMGEGLTSEQNERLCELAQAIDAPVSKTEIIESEPLSNEHMHHGEPSSLPTYVDLGFEQSDEANHTSSVEKSSLGQQIEDQQLPVIDQTPVELSNKRKLESPCTKTILETPLLKRHSSTSEYSLGKSLVWGRTNFFALTNKGDNGRYPSGVVVNEVACDPEVKGRYLGRSYGGFRDQFYIGPCSDIGGMWSRKEYHGPWFND